MALCQYLEDMPICFSHDLGDLKDVTVRNRFVKKIAHRVDENLFGALPSQWVLELFRNKAHVEPLLKWMTRNSAKTLRESLSVAVLAAGTDL
jgi:2,4-dienoyl-CoA reductase-like NADH-dependent reductase (Old Yellow Enzyme family)